MMKKMLALVLVLTAMLSVWMPASAAANETAQTGASNWSSLYENFVKNKQYQNDLDSYLRSNTHSFFLYDLDFDGSPELVVNAGMMVGFFRMFFYTVKNGSVTLVGKGAFGSASGGSPDLSFKGLFNRYYKSGIVIYDYYVLKNGALQNERVMTQNEQADYSFKVTDHTKNDALYKTFLSITKVETDTGMRTFKKLIKAYSYSEIFQDLGWKKFVGKFQYLATPKVTKFENVSAGVKLSWKKAASAAKTRVFVKSGSSWNTLGYTTGTSFTHKTDKSSKKYVYTIRFVDEDGNSQSGYNTTGFSFVHYNVLSAPMLKSVKNTSSGVRFVFKQTKGASKYRVFRKTASSWKKLGDVVGSRDYILDKTAKNGTTYVYTVRCLSADGKKYESGFNKTGLKIKCKR